MSAKSKDLLQPVESEKLVNNIPSNLSNNLIEQMILGTLLNNNDYFAKRYDIDPNSVSRHISLLKKLK